VPQKEKDKEVLLSAERKITSQFRDTYGYMNLITENELLYCRYITSDTIAFPFFTYVNVRIFGYRSVTVVEIWVGGEENF
jgi:hypothetical protein